jgi:hypothetical protein
MKTNRFLSLAAIFAITFTFFACTNEPSEPQSGEPSSDSVTGELPGGEPSSDSSPGEPQISSSSLETPSSSSSVIIECKDNFLGMGYDVIKSGYINYDGVRTENPILDQNKMCQDAIIVTEVMPGGSQAYDYFTSNSIKSFYQKRNANIGFGYGNGITGTLFSGNFSTEFSNATNQNSAERIFYSRVVSHRYTQADYIKNPTLQNLKEYLTPSFRDALKNRTASEILNQYGTHIFIRYYKGGSLEANYTYTGTSLSNETQVDAAVRASFAGISGSASTSTQVTEIEKAENTSFKYYVYGGRAIGATSIQQLKNEYSGWVNSIANNANICGISNFDQSFIAIWELAKAAGKTLKATQLESEFKSRAATQGVALPGARIYKTADYKNQTTSGPVSLTPPTGGTIAEIEIYALGAGGGGQGGNLNSGTFLTERGTGGAGGGGSAAYLKLGNNQLGLAKNGSVSLNVIIGTGGAGGSATTTSSTYAGCSGEIGGTTTVTWSTKSITLKAPGGSGGGAGSTNCPPNNTIVTGGPGGTEGSANPNNNALYVGTPYFAPGNPGTDGNIDIGTTSKASTGGKAALIEKKGTLPKFGDGSGAIREAGANTYTPAQNGGGGVSGHMNMNITQTKGGDGLVTIVYKYYTEE